jgi:hypothetical protein
MAMVAPREKRGRRRTNSEIVTQAAIVIAMTTPSRTHRPEPAVFSGTSQARLARLAMAKAVSAGGCAR